MVFETSAKTNYGMEDMMYEIAVEIDAQKETFEALFNKRSTSVALTHSLKGSIKGPDQSNASRRGVNDPGMSMA